MTTRQRVLKTLLWTAVGVLIVVTLARFYRGLGATTDLSDAAPWGFWIAFDVMAGVALAAGGFVLAATVYVFRLERYRPFARPAVLTAFLGYAAVATGLLYDLGLPWNIWHPAIFPQPHSVLFEVAMCVMLYLTVLMLEFAPVILEHPRLSSSGFLKAIHRGLKKATIVLVIVGIMLSTLHQSSLGSLFLIAPFRLNPLWYSPYIWLLFFVSAIGLGLMTVTLESFFSAWFFGHRLRMDLLPGLGKAASVVLLLYAALRLGDLGMRGQLGHVLDGSTLSAVFVFELALSVVPGLLLLLPRVRQSPRGLGASALMTVFGVMGYRFNVCIVAFARPEHASYFPSWMEVAVSVGIVAAALLVFIFFVENLEVYPGEHEAVQAVRAHDFRRYNPGALWPLTPDALAAPRRHSLALVLGIALAVALLPADALWGPRPVPTPVQPPRVVEGFVAERADGQGNELVLASSRGGPPKGTERIPVTLIDGDRDGRLVAFDHDVHVAELGGDATCTECHHQTLPFQQNSGCHECHRDMYSTSDVFDHAEHVARLDGNQSCPRCHTNQHAAKTRANSTPCDDCHADMVAKHSRIPAPSRGMTGMAPSYMEAMHGLCITCHEEKVRDEPRKYSASFAECGECHRDTNGTAVRRMAPYLTARGEADSGRPRRP
jgi:Ni/Fe-hydrogenase subunit HybB-like protein